MRVECVPVLMYHRIGEARNEWERRYCISATRFARHMDALARAGWHALALDDFFAWLDGRLEFGRPSFLLTFDDGFRSVHDHAAGILRAKGWPATVFLVSGLLGATDEWCATRNPAGSTYSLMGAREIDRLRADGFTFQSHTRTHADLTVLDDAALDQELTGSRSDLQDVLGERIDCLAYPYGKFDDRTVEAARASGYRAAFSTRPGFNRVGVHPYCIRRLEVYGTDSASALKRKMMLGSNDGSVGHALRYGWSRIAARLRRTPLVGAGNPR